MATTSELYEMIGELFVQRTLMERQIEGLRDTCSTLKDDRAVLTALNGTLEEELEGLRAALSSDKEED